MTNRKDLVDSDPEYVDQDYNRKFYRLDGVDDFVNDMKKVAETAIYNQTTYAQSEMKKPYLTADYHQMEDVYAAPMVNFAWPEWIYPYFPTPVPIVTTTNVRWYDLPVASGWAPGDGVIEEAETVCPPCIITCYGGGCDSDGNVIPIQCHHSVACFTTENPYGSWRVAAVSPAPAKKSDFSISGAGFSDYINITGPTSPGSLPADGNVSVLVEFTDGTGITCITSTNWLCLPCSCSDPYSWPMTNPTTISRGETKIVTVSGGCPPYKWELIEEEATETSISSSYGYYIGAATTWEKTNAVTARDLVCGDTSDKLSPKVKIQVTDDCNRIITETLRNGVGHWEWWTPTGYSGVVPAWTALNEMTLDVDYHICYDSGYCPNVQDHNPVDGGVWGVWVIQGEKLWHMITSLIYDITFYTTPSWESHIFNDTGFSVPPPPCGDPLSCYGPLGPECGSSPPPPKPGKTQCYPFYYGLATWKCDEE
jgi:hypothetical protein